jgi:hypothetical protein
VEVTQPLWRLLSFSFNKTNPEKQRQKALAFAYTKAFFACGQMRNWLVALQPHVRLNKKEVKYDFHEYLYMGTRTEK